MAEFKEGDKFTLVEDTVSGDAKAGTVYTIAGHDEDGDPYFLDDVGDRNFAVAWSVVEGSDFFRVS